MSVNGPLWASRANRSSEFYLMFVTTLRSRSAQQMPRQSQLRHMLLVSLRDAHAACRKWKLAPHQSDSNCMCEEVWRTIPQDTNLPLGAHVGTHAISSIAKSPGHACELRREIIRNLKALKKDIVPRWWHTHDLQSGITCLQSGGAQQMMPRLSSTDCLPCETESLQSASAHQIKPRCQTYLIYNAEKLFAICQRSLNSTKVMKHKWFTIANHVFGIWNRPPNHAKVF